MSLASLLSLGRSKEEEKPKSATKPATAEPTPAVAEEANKPRVAQNEEDRKLALELAEKQAETLSEEMAMREAEEEADRERSVANAAKAAKELAQKQKSQQAAPANPFSTGGRQFTPGVFVCDERSGHKPQGAVSSMPPPKPLTLPQDWMSLMNAAMPGGLAAGLQSAAASAAAPRSFNNNADVPAAFPAAVSQGGSPSTFPQYRQGAMQVSANRSRSRSPPPSNNSNQQGFHGGCAAASQSGHSSSEWSAPCSGRAGAPTPGHQGGDQRWHPPQPQMQSHPLDLGYGPPASQGGWAGYRPPGGYGAAPGGYAYPPGGADGYGAAPGGYGYPPRPWGY